MADSSYPPKSSIQPSFDQAQDLDGSARDRRMVQSRVAIGSRRKTMEIAMRGRQWIVALALICSPNAVAVAQSGLEKPGNQAYVPQLGDLMDSAQARHIKL